MRDAIAVGASLAICAGASMALYIDANLSRTQSGQAIGTVSYTRKSAERRPSDDVVWDAVKRESPLYDKDTVRTDDDSSAVLTLTDGTKLTLDEQTMITIERPSRGGVRVGLERGAMRAARTEAASGQMRVSASGGAVAMTTGDAVIRADNSNLTASVASGSATVTAVKGQIMVGAREEAVVASGTAVKKADAIALITPAFDEVFVAADIDVPVTFRWSGGARATLIVSSDHAFNDVVLTRKNESNASIVPLAAGRYFWRVTSGPVSSEVRRVIIEKAALPTLIAPADGAVIRQKAASLVTFTWHMPTAISSTLEISADNEFRTVTKSAPTALSEIARSMALGPYFWRVRSVIDTGYRTSEIVSAARALTVTNAVSPRVTLVYPADGASMDGESASNAFSCSPVDGARSYTLVVSRDGSGTDAVFQGVSELNVISVVKHIAPGEYRWRMRANDGSAEIAASATRRLIVTGAMSGAAAGSTNISMIATNTPQTNGPMAAVKDKPVRPRPIVVPVKTNIVQNKEPMRRTNAARTASPVTAISLSVSPPGATVVYMVNGKPRAMTSGISVIAPGTYTVFASLDGYIPLKRTVTIAKGETNAVALELRRKVIVTERITLLDDTVISGKIVKQTAAEVHIDTDDGRKIIKRDEIQGVQYLKK
ncbi:MAG: FecR domain-containing protein [Spirochaetota bacterium]